MSITDLEHYTLVLSRLGFIHKENCLAERRTEEKVFCQVARPDGEIEVYASPCHSAIFSKEEKFLRFA